MIKESIFELFLFFVLFMGVKGSSNDLSNGEEGYLSSLGGDMNRLAIPFETLPAGNRSTVNVSLDSSVTDSSFDNLIDEENINPCPICYGSLEIDSFDILTKCGHMFHENCLAGWFIRKIDCPSCRFDLRHMTVHSKRKDFEDFVIGISAENFVKKDEKELIGLIIYAEVNKFTKNIAKILKALLEKKEIAWNHREVSYRLIQLMSIIISKSKIPEYQGLWNRMAGKYFENDITKLISGKSLLIKSKAFEKFIPSLIKIAILLGADVNKIDEKTGKTSIELTATDEQLDIFKIILDSDRADISKIDPNGMSILHSAIDSGYFEVAKTILNLETPFYRAQIQNIINHLDNQGRSPLDLAMTHNNPEIFKLLLIVNYKVLDQKCIEDLSLLEKIIKDCNSNDIFNALFEIIEIDVPKFKSAVNFAQQHPEHAYSSAILAKTVDWIVENRVVREIIKSSRKSQQKPAAFEAELNLKKELTGKRIHKVLPKIWGKIVANDQIEEVFNIFKKLTGDEKFSLFVFDNVAKQFVRHMLRSDKKDEFLDVYFDPCVGSGCPVADMISSLALCEGIEDERINSYLQDFEYGPFNFWMAMINYVNVDDLVFNNIRAKWEENKVLFIFAPYHQGCINHVHKCELLIDIYENNKQLNDKTVWETIAKWSEDEIYLILLLLTRNENICYVKDILEVLDKVVLENVSKKFANEKNFELFEKLRTVLPKHLRKFIYREFFLLAKRRFKIYKMEIDSESKSACDKYNFEYHFSVNIDGIDKVVFFCPNLNLSGPETIDQISAFKFLSPKVLLNYMQLTSTLVPANYINYYYERNVYGSETVQLIANSKEIINFLMDSNICLPINNEAIVELKLERNSRHFKDLHKVFRFISFDLAYSKEFNYLENLEIISGKDIITLLNESDIILGIERDPYEYMRYRHIFNYMMTKSPQLIHKIRSKLLKKIINADFSDN